MLPTTTFKEEPYSSVTSLIPVNPLYIVGNTSDAPSTPPEDIQAALKVTEGEPSELLGSSLSTLRQEGARPVG